MNACGHGHDFLAALRHAGVRPTTYRMAVLAALHEHGRMSADEVASVREARGMDRVTAYRSLKALVRAGLVCEVVASHAAARYELTAHHSHVLVCTRCGREETTACDLPAFEGRSLARSKHFSSIHSHAVSLFGTCKKCAIQQ